MCLAWQNAWEITFPKQGLEWNDWCASMNPFGQEDCEMHLPQNICFEMMFTGTLFDCRKGSEQNWLKTYLSFIMTFWNALKFTVSVTVSGKCLCSPRLSQELVNIWDRFGQVCLALQRPLKCMSMLGCFLGDFTEMLSSKFWVLGKSVVCRGILTMEEEVAGWKHNPETQVSVMVLGQARTHLWGWGIAW